MAASVSGEPDPTTPRSPPAPSPPGVPWPALVTLAGGLLVAVAPLLPWATADVAVVGTVTRSAVDEGKGWAFVAAGLLICVLGARTLLRGSRRGAQVAQVVVALAVVGAGVWVYADVSHQFRDLRDTATEASGDIADVGIDLAPSDLVELRHGTGNYLVLAGGVLSLVGAPRAFGRRRP